MPDLSTLFAFELGIAEMAIRGTVIYWGVFLMLRIACLLYTSDAADE